MHCITSLLKRYDALCEKQTDIKRDSSLKHDHLSSFTLPHAVPNLYDVLRIFKSVSNILPYILFTIECVYMHPLNAITMRF